MKVHCAILGFPIDRAACAASGNHPLCRKCRGEVQDPEETPALPLDGKRRPRRRCECGRAFFPKSNRQRLCSKCSEMEERRRKAEWARKNRENISVSRRLERNFRNEIVAF